MCPSSSPPAYDLVGDSSFRCTGAFRGGRRGVVTTLLAGLVAVVAAAPTPAVAESLLLNPPPGWNGLIVTGSVRAGWKENGGAAEVSTAALSFLSAAPFPPLTPGQVLTGAPPHLTSLPMSGDPKDRAAVKLTYDVTVGAAGPGSSDKFTLGISATTSAVTAQYDFGGGLVNADAFVAVDFAIMTSSPVPAATLASFGLPSLPALTASPPNVESLNAKAEIGPYGAPTTTIVMTPGYAGSVLPLVLGPFTSEFFIYSLSYRLLTPYGTDPSVAIALEGSMERTNAVPELGLAAGPLALLLGGLGLLEKTRRRQASS